MPGVAYLATTAQHGQGHYFRSMIYWSPWQPHACLPLATPHRVRGLAEGLARHGVVAVVQQVARALSPLGAAAGGLLREPVPHRVLAILQQGPMFAGAAGSVAHVQGAELITREAWRK